MKPKQIGKIFGELIGYTIALLFIYKIIPGLSFVKDSYFIYQPIAFWTTTANVVLKIIKHVLPPKPLKSLFEGLSLIPSLYGIYKLREIFPVDFGAINHDNWNGYFSTALLIFMFLTGIGIVVNLAKIFAPEKIRKLEEETDDEDELDDN